jgi:hypothetical protein
MGFPTDDLPLSAQLDRLIEAVKANTEALIALAAIQPLQPALPIIPPETKPKRRQKGADYPAATPEMSQATDLLRRLAGKIGDNAAVHYITDHWHEASPMKCPGVDLLHGILRGRGLYGMAGGQYRPLIRAEKLRIISYLAQQGSELDQPNIPNITTTPKE